MGPALAVEPPANAEPEDLATPPTTGTTVVVASGDSFWGIAEQVVSARGGSPRQPKWPGTGSSW